MKSKEQIDKEFIEAFGKEQWEIEEAISKLEPISKEIAEYLGVPQVPIVVENIPEDSRMNFQFECIILRKDTALNYLEGLKVVVVAVWMEQKLSQLYLIEIYLYLLVRLF